MEPVPRGLSRRIDRVGIRLAVDPHLGNWDDVRWTSRVFGLNLTAVVTEGHRFIALCDEADWRP